MKFLSAIVFLTLSFSAHAFDHKQCVLNKVSARFKPEDSCFEEKIREALHKVMSDYSQCNLEFFNQTTNKDLEELKKQLSGNYDSEIEKLFADKFQDCGITGSVTIEEKGRKRTIRIIEIKGKGKKAESAPQLSS